LELSSALERGIRFIVAQQSDDGLWRDFLTPAGEASEWPTGFIGATLAVVGADDAALHRALDALVVRQRDDGGWGYNRSVPTDADSTAWVLLFLALMGRRGSECDRAASCLVRHQGPAGGVATYREPGPIRRFMGVGRWVRFGGWCRPHTEVTATAGRALAALDSGSDAEAIAAAWRYVRSQQRPDGCWPSYWWTSPHYATVEAMQLAPAGGGREAVDRAAAWVLQSQQHDGAWSAPGVGASAFATALSLSVLLGAGAAGAPVDRAVARLCAFQEGDGGWPCHPMLRIPLPGDAHPDRHRPRPFGRGVVVRDQHRTFTSAVCVAALARACATCRTPD
jgi:squalene cyclase